MTETLERSTLTVVSMFFWPLVTELWIIDLFSGNESSKVQC